MIIPTATKLSVRLIGGPKAHPTAGYRLWRGTFEASEPIVALVMIVCGNQTHWTRTSHRGTSSLETSILFSPNDEEGRSIQVSFHILDAGAIGQACVDSLQTQPAPLLQTYVTGGLVHVASVSTEPRCELKAIFLARRDVASVRNGVWHARGEVSALIAEPWHTMLTYGRTGVIEAA